MAEDAEFAQFIAAATTPEAPAATETPAAGPPAEAPDAAKVEPEASAEKPVEAKPEESKKPEPDWKKAAAAEKAKREAKQAGKANEAKLQQQLAEVNSELAEWREFKALREKDPLAAAEKAQLNYDKLTKEYIKTLEKNPNQPPPEIQLLSQKIQQVETLLSQQQQSIQLRAQEEAIRTFQAEVKQMLEAKGDEFELTKAARQGPDLVREIVAAHYRATATFDKSGNIIAPGEVMPTDEACRKAEKYLEEDIGQFKGTKKFGGKTEAAKPAPPKAPDKPTLSQDMRTGGVKANEPHGDEVEQLLLLKKTLEAQLNASQGN